MNVLYIVSLLMLNVFAEEVYRQKRDESKEKSIDADEDTKDVGLRDNKRSLDCIFTELFGSYLLGTATCYRKVRLQAAADNSSNIKESKQGTKNPVIRVVLYPKYKPAGTIGYNNIAIFQVRFGLAPRKSPTVLPPNNCHILPGSPILLSREPLSIGNGDLIYPTVEAKVARIQACAIALINGINSPNLFCVKLTRCYPDFDLQGLPASRNGQFKGILLSARCSRGAMYLVYLAISPYTRWITQEMRNTPISIGTCN